MSETIAPAIVYSCKFMNGSHCDFKGICPSGARDSFGDRWCRQSASNSPNNIDCNNKEIKETKVGVHISSGGMMS